MSDASLTQRAPLCWLLVPLVLGLVIAKLSPVALPLPLLTAVALLAVAVAQAVSVSDSPLWAAALTVALVAAGASYYEVRRDRLPAWETLPVREAELTVRIDRVFADGGQAERFSALGKIRDAAPHLHDLTGQMVALALRIDPAEIRPIRGTTVRVLGVIAPLPRRPTAEAFDTYLIDAGVNFRVHRGRLLAVAAPASSYATWRETVRQRASARLGLGLDNHPELVAALRGMLLGERAGLSEDQKALFLRSGAMHLFAISGLHIGVIAGGIIGLLRLVRAPRPVTFVLGSAALWFYVDLTGAVPSAVRAWLMIVCLHASFVFRAPGNPLAALAASALLVLLLDPMQLFGAGFQMSYGVVAALLLYGLPLGAAWTHRHALWTRLPQGSQRRWHRGTAFAWRALMGATAISVAAALIGTISGIAFFRLFTPVGVVANLVLIPLATGAILSGFLSLLTALGGLEVTGLLFNHAAGVLLAVMRLVLETLTQVPGTATTAQFRAGWMGSAAIAFMITFLMCGYARRWERFRGGYWGPFALLAAILGLAVQFG